MCVLQLLCLALHCKKLAACSFDMVAMFLSVDMLGPSCQLWHCALTVWCPAFPAWAHAACAQAGNVLFEQYQKEIDISFGLATIITAIIATLAGAWLVDHLGSSIRTSMLFCGISTLVGFGLLEAAFAVPDTFPVFLMLFSLGEVACFAGTAPASKPSPPFYTWRCTCMLSKIAGPAWSQLF